MIPSSFDYHAPMTVDEAVSLLVQYGENAKLLAGGHSLLPMMKLRFAEPAHLVDLVQLTELKGIQLTDRSIQIGAMTTETELLESAVIQENCRLLIDATRQIADPQVRNKGTIGGDIAHGDPGNDHPAIMLALDASFTIQGPDGERKVDANHFFLGTYWTDLQPAEILTQIEIPLASAKRAYGFKKLKRKTGDFATAAATVSLREEAGVCRDVRISLTNAAPCAFRVARAEAALEGKVADEAVLDEIAALVTASCQPAEDLRGDASYKAHMAGEMTRRALLQALSREAA